jgi:type III secretion protein R
MTETQPAIVALLAVTLGLGILAFLVVTSTAFLKISIVLFLVRSALGAQQVPPNIVIYGAALILTVFICAPVAQQMYDGVSAPGQRFETFDDYRQAFDRAQLPVKNYLQRFTNRQERQFFLDATERVWPENMRQRAQGDDLTILVPAYMIGELKRAFEIGFLLYLPFVTIDLVVTTILMAMGMSMVSPTIISIPFKLFLFIAIDGWSRLMHGLVISYAS